MTKEEVIEKVKKEAEGYFERGEFFCSESVVYTINNLLGKPYDENIVKVASGFPIGMGKAGCLCGAISGGQIGLGMAYGRTHGQPMNENMFLLSKELHDYIKNEYGATCCRVITKQWAGDNFQSPERKKHCIEITGKVAAWVAEKLIENGQVKIQ
ncbi:C_GCAxxG_C_C family probable redox protein [Keratinibaculum paraultunense]|uniref:C_GCAxxG_C_C family probable redox protein n=1 Tax=Keratinibaculum paraultunense TaxID=1278232 RepID=A0A4R3KQ87_9FIRM|nr:C-GCAxxG-C-C family protein [Keratinibaculum paraultunense]QQY79753.1 C_GCAxxG_C_C family protein [Keratinibaculum paraultunense]TCS86938.1 C_GCAxxG_C_C family probable redox protein [Keratinibaculum paraultunense]